MDEQELNDATVETRDDDGKSAISADLIRGHINTIILRTLYERDKYGYEIIEEIERKSHGQYSLKQPTLYSALKRLETQGYINAYWKTDEVSLGGRRKYYTLTDSGREITEKNQAEWEYSRTVIDNLISDRSFDFSQPAPTPVDFKLLKKSTSRVPVMKDGEAAEADEKKEENATDVATTKAHAAEAEAPAQKAETFEQPSRMTEEERRTVHENYLKLISDPPAPVKEVEIMPVADKIDTEKLMYNNRPETERDYRNLINNLFDKTVKYNPLRQENPQPEAYIPKPTRVKNDIEAKAEADGIKLDSAEYVVNGRKKSYNLGGTLLKCSLIIAVIMMFEFTICLLFKNELSINLAYPFVIFALAAAQLAIFTILYYTDIGKIMRRPSSSLYLTACFIVTIILIAIIFLVSLLIGVNFAAVGDIFAKIIIPIFVALNIPTFAVCFYSFSR